MQWLGDAACPRWGGAMDFFRQLFLSGDFQPHGFCYRWNSGLVWLNFISDVLIALAYFTIPFTLLWFIRKRRDLPFSWMFMLFGLFIVASGTPNTGWRESSRRSQLWLQFPLQFSLFSLYPRPLLSPVQMRSKM